jgi:hypothetical protein
MAQSNEIIWSPNRWSMTPQSLEGRAQRRPSFVLFRPCMAPNLEGSLFHHSLTQGSITLAVLPAPMAPRSIHPFHQIRYLGVDLDPPTRRDPATKLSLADAPDIPPLHTSTCPLSPRREEPAQRVDLLPFDGVLVLGSSTSPR